MDVRQHLVSTLTALLLAAPGQATAQLARYRALIVPSETREFFSVVGDTFPAASGDAAQRARETAVRAWSGDFQVDTSCTVAFDAGSSWLVYMLDQCHDRSNSVYTIEDGDALVQVSRDGRRAIKTLINPGGIDMVER